MEFTFSDKYEPLFELLEAKSIVEGVNFKFDYTHDEQERWLLISEVDTVLISGGRDSSKSFSLSVFNPVAARDYNHRILYTRQTMSSTDNSITEALENRIDDLGMSGDFTVANKIYSTTEDSEGNPRRGKISITGQKTSVGTNTAKLKSLEDFSIFETDEGEELESHESWKKTKRSMRAQDVQCLSIILFNPPTKEHWLHEEFYEGVPEGFNGVKGKTLYIHTTYLDNGKENMASHNWDEYEALRLDYELYLNTSKEDRESLSKIVVKNYNQYRYDILGGFKNKAEGVIYEDWEIGEFDDSLGYLYGFDPGQDHPTGIVKVAVDTSNMRIYLKEELYASNKSSAWMVEFVKKMANGKTVVCDPAGKQQIRDFRENDIEAVPALKGPESVIMGIRVLKSYTLVIDPSSENLVKELNNYIWDSKKQDTPVKKWDDLLDAARYAVRRLLRF